MSHKEDQLMEVEALESIFPNEIESKLLFHNAQNKILIFLIF